MNAENRRWLDELNDAQTSYHVARRLARNAFAVRHELPMIYFWAKLHMDRERQRFEELREEYFGPLR